MGKEVESKNNWHINVSHYLNEKYPNWGKTYPEIVELDNDLNLVRVWNNKKDICREYNIRHIQALDISLRRCVRTKGKFFLVKKLYDEGLRPIPSQKRNEKIFAYNPSKEITDKFNNYEEVTYQDILNDKENFSLIACFENSVACSNFLDLSITNVRIVAKQKNMFYKEYYFTFEPLLAIQEIYAILVDLLHKAEACYYILSEEDRKRGIECIKTILDKDINSSRAKGFLEQKIMRILKRNSVLKEEEQLTKFLKEFREEKEEYIEE